MEVTASLTIDTKELAHLLLYVGNCSKNAVVDCGSRSWYFMDGERYTVLRPKYGVTNG